MTFDTRENLYLGLFQLWKAHVGGIALPTEPRNFCMHAGMCLLKKETKVCYKINVTIALKNILT